MSQHEADGWVRFLLLILVLVVVAAVIASVYHVASTTFHQLNAALVGAIIRNGH